MFCKKCGNQLEDGAQFCPKCGANMTAGEKLVGGENKTQSPKVDNSKVLYTAKRSIWAKKRRIISCSITALLLIIIGAAIVGDAEWRMFGIVMIAVGVLFIAPIVLIVIEASKNEIKFYQTKIVVKSGLFNTKEDQSIMTPIVGVSVGQTINGKIWNYGAIKIDKIGTGWDINTTYIKRPNDLKKFLESLIDNTDYSRTNLHMSN